MNSFQKYMVSDSASEVVKNIVQLYHPELDVSNLQLEVSCEWNHVIIHSIKEKVYIVITYGLSGFVVPFHKHIHGEKTLADFEGMECKFFATRSYYIEGKDISTPNPDINHLMGSVPKPTAEEMFNYYNTTVWKS